MVRSTRTAIHYEKHVYCIVMQEASDAHSKTADSADKTADKTADTIVLAVARLSAPATTATHSRVIRLRRVLTDHPPSGSSIDPASVAV